MEDRTRELEAFAAAHATVGKQYLDDIGVGVPREEGWDATAGSSAVAWAGGGLILRPLRGISSPAHDQAAASGVAVVPQDKTHLALRPAIDALPLILQRTKEVCDSLTLMAIKRSHLLSNHPPFVLFSKFEK